MPILWRLTHLLLSSHFFETRPLKQNSTRFLLPKQTDFMSSIIPFLFFLDYSTIDYNKLANTLKTIEEEKTVTCSENTALQKQRVQQLSKTKQTITVIVCLLEKLAQLFYLAHFFVFFLVETQMPRQKQKWDHRPQHVFGNWQKDLQLQTDAAT